VLDEQEQPKTYRGIPDKARTTAADKRAKAGVNLTEQAKRAREQMRAKYEAQNPSVFEKAISHELPKTS
jgi:hypothetical protein